ncbi:MAG: hypothetical protein JSU65_05615 [Candidatus Zixiibacteriota bacterium]|nr:MAG: hypothetical protein JSU65_05615 [candidate division Zixibacteria bacterium]
MKILPVPIKPIPGPYFAAITLMIACLVSWALVSCGDGDMKRQSSVSPMQQFAPESVEGWALQDTVAVYDRETIFDYINGAGEVYLSYDFRELAVFQYARPDRPPITLEIFDMSEPSEAYGIFSHAREDEREGIGNGYEASGGLLCFWQSQYFVCVQAGGGSSDEQAAMRTIAGAVASQLPPGGEKPGLLDLLPTEGMTAYSSRYFHGHPSLNYHYYVSERNILGLSRNTNGALARYEPGSVFLVCIEYPSEAEASEARESFRDAYLPDAGESGMAQTENGKWTAISLKNKYLVIVLDAQTQQETDGLLQGCRENIS